MNAISREKKHGKEFYDNIRKNGYCNGKNRFNDIRIIAIIDITYCNKILDNRFMEQKLLLQ